MAFKDEKHKRAVDSLQTAAILKESIRIVDELAKFGNASGYTYTEEEIEDLIDRAEKLSKHRLWKLK